MKIHRQILRGDKQDEGGGEVSVAAGSAVYSGVCTSGEMDRDLVAKS